MLNTLCNGFNRNNKDEKNLIIVAFILKKKTQTMGFDGGLENVNYSESNPIDLILIEFFLDPTHFIISELHH